MSNSAVCHFFLVQSEHGDKQVLPRQRGSFRSVGTGGDFLSTSLYLVFGGWVG